MTKEIKIEDAKFNEVIETLKQAFGSDSVTIISTNEDVANLQLELELRDYLKAGGRLN